MMPPIHGATGSGGAYRSEGGSEKKIPAGSEKVKNTTRDKLKEKLQQRQDQKGP